MSEKKETLRKGSRKFILQFTLPSGQRLAASGFEGKFALVPISGNGAKGMFLMFDTPQEVSKFLKNIKKQNEAMAKKLWTLRPEVLPVIVTEVGFFPMDKNFKGKPLSIVDVDPIP